MLEFLIQKNKETKNNEEEAINHEMDEEDAIEQSKTKKNALSNEAAGRYLLRTLDILMYAIKS